MTSHAGYRRTAGASDAESILAEARRALFVMVGFLAILWIVQLANFADHYRLSYELGIAPRSVSSLPDILSAPFIHLSWTHIESNSGPLFIFGFLAAYRGVVRFLGLTVLVIVGSGTLSWLTAPAHTVGVGASGVVFGYLGYILVRGLFDRHMIDVVIGAVMALCFAYQFTVLLPQAGVGWQDHIGGLVTGIAGGWIFKDRRAAARRKAAAGKTAAGQAGEAATAAAARGENVAAAAPAENLAAAGETLAAAAPGENVAAAAAGVTVAGDQAELPAEGSGA